MKIIKYFFFILSLLSIAFFVFVATQPSNYKFVVTKNINAPKKNVEDLIKNKENWKNWLLDTTKNNITNSIFSSDSIVQSFENQNYNYQNTWRFLEQKNTTTVSCSVSGTLSFKQKAHSILSENIEKSINSEVENHLQNIQNYISKELQFFDIKINGIVAQNPMYFILQRDSTVMQNKAKLFSKWDTLRDLALKDTLSIIGNKFNAYNTFTKQKIYFGYPIEKIYNAKEKTEIEGAYFGNYKAVKITLKGNYNHIKKAWKAAEKYMLANKLYISKSYPTLEVFVKDATNMPNASDWITELYIPIVVYSYKPKTTENINNTVISEENNN